MSEQTQAEYLALIVGHQIQPLFAGSTHIKRLICSRCWEKTSHLDFQVRRDVTVADLLNPDNTRLACSFCHAPLAWMVLPAEPASKREQSVTTRERCPHDTLNFDLLIPQAPKTGKLDAWLAAPLPFTRTRVSCTDCKEEVQVASVLSAEGLAAIAATFGDVWKQRLEEEWERGAKAMIEWHTQYMATRHKGQKG